MKPVLITFQGIFSLISSLIISFFEGVLPGEVTILIIITFVCVINKLLHKDKWGVSTTVSIISVGMSYGIKTFVAFITSLMFALLPEKVLEITPFRILFVAIIFSATGLVTFGIFKIRRLKNGFPFIGDGHTNLLGIIIALATLQFNVISSMLLDTPSGVKLPTIFFIIMSEVICLAFIVIWWKVGITNTYKNRLILKESKSLYKEILDRDSQIEKLKVDNDVLSRMIHSDNKQLPALKNAVEQLYGENPSDRGKAVLNELERVSSMRRSILNKHNKKAKSLPSTEVVSLDIMLDFMKEKAYENDIEFDAFINGDISEMIKQVTSEEKFRTVITDLIENAIIATKGESIRHILLTLGMVDNCYEIRVEDSGKDFDEKVLLDLGKKRVTTHESEGGSGIGMMEVFGFAVSNEASLYISPLNRDKRGFAKRIAIKFDKKGECIVGHISENRILNKVNNKNRKAG